MAQPVGQSEAWGCELTDLMFKRQRGDSSLWALEVPELSVSGGSSRNNKVPIMGSSGSGKTTLMNMMAAMEWPNGAESQIAWSFPNGDSMSWGHRGPTWSTSRRLRQRHFGFAFQDSSLIPHLTIGQNLSFPLELQGKPKREAEEKSADYLERVLKGGSGAAMLKKFPSELSGGELQRAALVQAMVHDPSVLFADEPTGSLDAATRELVMTVLSNWVDEKPNERLLIWITHHSGDPESLGARRRIRLADGAAHWQVLEPGYDQWHSDGSDL